MTRLTRAALFGLLWLAVSSTAFATPLLSIDFVLDDSDATVFPQFAYGDPQLALDQWCQDPAHYVTLTQRLDAAPDFQDVSFDTAGIPGVQPLDLSEVTSTPATLALSGAGLIVLGMIRRRKN